MGYKAQREEVSIMRINHIQPHTYVVCGYLKLINHREICEMVS
jgi:hypothetical protein